MQSTQRKRKDSTVISEQKAESAFAPFPRKSTRLFLLDKISFPEPKVESDLSSKPRKSSRLFLLTRFSNFLLSYPLNPFWTLYLIHIVPLLFVILGDYILRIIIH